MLEEAIKFAAGKHAGAVRKGSKLPAVVHALEALTITAKLTDDPEVLAAAVLHDVLEDTETEAAEIEHLFGRRVLELVQAESENKRRDGKLSPAQTWKIRKQESLAVLDGAGRDVLAIALGDKLSNLRSLAIGLSSEGSAFWNHFNMPDVSEQAWYYREMGLRFAPYHSSYPYKEYKWLLEEIFGPEPWL